MELGISIIMTVACPWVVPALAKLLRHSVLLWSALLELNLKDNMCCIY